MAKNCIFGGKEASSKSLKESASGAESQMAKPMEAPTVTVHTERELAATAPTRGPASLNPMQAQISAVLAASNFASFDSMDVGGSAKRPGDSANGKNVDKKSVGPSVPKRPKEGPTVATAPERPAVGPARGPPPSPAVAPSKGPAQKPASPEKEQDNSSSSSSDDEGQGINRTKKVRKYLEKMRGSGSKEVVGKAVAKKDKKKKEKKEKAKAMVAGPAETPAQIQEKKKKMKKEKKLAKAKKKEQEKEKLLIAAERETKRIFGRSALVISDSEESDSPEKTDAPDRPDV